MSEVSRSFPNPEATEPIEPVEADATLVRPDIPTPEDDVTESVRRPGEIDSFYTALGRVTAGLAAGEEDIDIPIGRNRREQHHALKAAKQVAKATKSKKKKEILEKAYMKEGPDGMLVDRPVYGKKRVATAVARSQARKDAKERFRSGEINATQYRKEKEAAKNNVVWQSHRGKNKAVRKFEGVVRDTERLASRYDREARSVSEFSEDRPLESYETYFDAASVLSLKREAEQEIERQEIDELVERLRDPRKRALTREQIEAEVRAKLLASHFGVSSIEEVYQVVPGWLIDTVKDMLNQPEEELEQLANGGASTDSVVTSTPATPDAPESPARGTLYERLARTEEDEPEEETEEKPRKIGVEVLDPYKVRTLRERIDDRIADEVDWTLDKYGEDYFDWDEKEQRITQIEINQYLGVDIDNKAADNEKIVAPDILEELNQMLDMTPEELQSYIDAENQEASSEPEPSQEKSVEIDSWEAGLKYVAAVYRGAEDKGSASTMSMSDQSMINNLAPLGIGEEDAIEVYERMKDEGIIDADYTPGVGFRVKKTADEILSLVTKK